MLFDLAQGMWVLPSQVIDDLMILAIASIRDFPSAILVQLVRDYALPQMKGQSVLNIRCLYYYLQPADIKSINKY